MMGKTYWLWVAVAAEAAAVAVVGVVHGGGPAAVLTAMAMSTLAVVAVVVSLGPWLRVAVTRAEREAALTQLPADLVAKGRRMSVALRPSSWTLLAVRVVVVVVVVGCGPAVVDVSSRVTDAWWMRAGLAALLLAATGEAARLVPQWWDARVRVRYGAPVGPRPGLPLLAGSVADVADSAGLLLVLYAAMHWWPQWWWLVLAVAVAAWRALRCLPAAPTITLAKGGTAVTGDQLRQRLSGVADHAGVRVAGITVLDMPSGTKLNAAVSGVGRWRRIVVSGPGLGGDRDLAGPVSAAGVEDEAAVMVAHEVAHARYSDPGIRVVVDTARVMLTLGLIVLAGHWPGLLHLAGAATLTDPHTVGVVLGILTVAGMVAVPVQTWLTRARERRADWYALHATADPAAVVAVQQRALRARLRDADPSLLTRLVESYPYAHPSLAERVATALKAAAAGQPAASSASHALAAARDRAESDA